MKAKSSKMYAIVTGKRTHCFLYYLQPMEVFVDDETKLTLHGLQQYYVKLKDTEKNRKLFDLLDVLEFNQVCTGVGWQPGLNQFYPSTRGVG